MKRRFAFVIFMTLPSPALSAEQYLCVLWTREAVRIELQTDPKLANATVSDILVLADQAYARCLLMETDKPELPDVSARRQQSWAEFMSRNTISSLGTTPAKDQPAERMTCSEGQCLDVKSEEWKAWCRANYHTYRERDDTVVRNGTGGRRVLCPG